jgi:hypothetical protein
MASIYQKFALVTAGTVLSVAFQNNTKVAAFTYNEAVNGDLPTTVEYSRASGSIEYINVFGLDLGTNTFTGEITFSDSDPFLTPIDSFDSFAFSIPTDTRLESVLLSISLLPGGSGIFNYTQYGIQTPPSIYPDFLAPLELITIPSTNVSLFTSVLPLESGVFGISNAAGVGGFLNPGESQTATYTFSLTVAPVACR